MFVCTGSSGAAGNSSGDTSSLSVEETKLVSLFILTVCDLNTVCSKLRAKLGLKPLEVEGVQNTTTEKTQGSC